MLDTHQNQEVVINFQHLFNHFFASLSEIETIIINSASGESNLIAEITQNLFSSGGKRIRPILLLASSQLCGNQNIFAQHHLASAVEIIHTATLLHDDVIDNSQVRRGKKTANALHDNKASILVGDYLFSLAFQLMVKTQNLSALQLLAKTSSIIADAEVLQLQHSSNISLTYQQYCNIIFGKTAVLFSASCEIGGLINQVSSQKIKHLQQFGSDLGMIFQIVDDILDYTANQQELGKNIGGDFFEGKITLPIILALKQANSNDTKTITELFLYNSNHHNSDQNNLNTIIAILNKYNAINESKNIAKEFFATAIKQLDLFSDCIAKQHLQCILQYALLRIF
jgi:octaprenyl-diphosphate synthase